MICTVIPTTLPHFSYTGFHIVYLSAPSPLAKNQLSLPIWMTLVLVILVFMYCVVSYHGNKKSSSSFNLTCILLCVLDFNTLLKSNRSFSFSTAKHYFMTCKLLIQCVAFFLALWSWVCKTLSFTWYIECALPQTLPKF